MKLDFTDKVRFYRTIGAMAAVVFVFIGCLYVLQPFLPAILLAVILCISAWPAFKKLERRLKGNTDLAAALMTLIVAMCFLVPLVLLGTSLVDSFRKLMREVTTAFQENNVVATPDWLSSLPTVGPHIDSWWQTHAVDKEHVLQTISVYYAPVTKWLILAGSGIGNGILDISLGIIIAFFFFQKGPAAVVRIRNLIENFGGSRSLYLLQICANTVIGVVYGILGTALMLGALAAAGFLIADVPGAPFLGLLTFLLGIIPGGPPFVLVPVTVWLFMKGHFGMGIFMGLWSAGIVVLLDLIIRPYLISMGSRMPLLLVLLGIFGGVAAFGFIGLFIGPALLAIAQALVVELSHKDETLPAEPV